MKHLQKVFALIFALLCLVSCAVTASAANVADATIDLSRTGSLDIYKYDITGAERDGVWDSSYVSTGVRDESGVEGVLGSDSRVSDLGNGGTSYGYAIKGVVFSYLKIADIRTYSEMENGAGHVEVLYGVPANGTTDQLLSVMGLTHESRYAPADQTVDGVLTYYYPSDTLIQGLEAALAANSTTVKNALEAYVRNNGGTAMPETDGYGHTSASGLPLGLYLCVETALPEMVTQTTDPFLVSLPMTSVNGTNANDGGDRWIYNVVLYPKNETGMPSLEKTVREAKEDTGKHNGSLTDITDGYAHTATASGYDKLNYQIHSTLPLITSDATYLTELTFKDSLSRGISYDRDGVAIEFFRDAACTDLITTWKETDAVKKFSVAYGAGENDGTTMTLSVTPAGLEEINASRLVYSGADMVNSGFSGCTMRITYNATLHSDASVVYGDGGNPNAVTMEWRRSNTPYKDRLDDDCHAFTYGIDLTKQFSDGAGNYGNVEMILHNDLDDYYVQAELHEDGVYYVTGHARDESNATRFVPTGSGKIVVKGLEDDPYTITETKTDNGYTLLRDDITVLITADEGELCDWYAVDELGIVQNDPRYTSVQKHLEHRLLTASATVDGNAVAMNEDNGSVNALVPMTVVNTRGFDLPKTGSHGNWMFPVIGLSVAAAAAAVVFFLRERRGA